MLGRPRCSPRRQEVAIPPKRNPLRLNRLQLKTLTLFQALAEAAAPDGEDPETGDVTVAHIPRPHGDHFHVGPYVVMARDATGLANVNVWVALERKGLIRSGFPIAVTLTAAGRGYDTGMGGGILIGADHGAPEADAAPSGGRGERPPKALLG